MRSNTYSLNGHMPTDGEYLEYMRVVANHSPGDFLITRTAHVRYLQNGDAANVLAHILNLLRMKHSNEEDQERLQQNMMWIKCPLKSIAAQLNLGKHQAPAAVKALVNAGVLETDNRGVPQTMWVRVSAEKLVEIERWNLQYEAELRGKTQKPKKRVSNNPESGASETRNLGFYNTNNPPNNLPLTGEAPASEPNSNSRGSGSSKTNHRQSNQTAEVETSKTSNSRISAASRLLEKKETYSPFCYQAQTLFRSKLREHGHRPVYGHNRTGWSEKEGAKWVSFLLELLDGDEARLLWVFTLYPKYAEVVADAGGPSEVFSIKQICSPAMFKALERYLKKYEDNCPAKRKEKETRTEQHADGTVTTYFD